MSVVEHPARMRSGATIMQATCAALGLLSSIAAWLAGAAVWWLVAGVLLGSVVPFTLIVILPTNKQLLSATLDRQSAQTKRLLARWGALHVVRSVLLSLSFNPTVQGRSARRELAPARCWRNIASLI